MNKAATDLLLGQMFRVRRTVLRAGAVFLGLLFAGYVNSQTFLLTDRGELVLTVALLPLLLVIFIGSLVTCYYVFRVGLREAGLGYAIGHALLFVGLTYMLLIGIIVVPLLVRCDIERWRRWDDALTG